MTEKKQPAPDTYLRRSLCHHDIDFMS